MVIAGMSPDEPQFLRRKRTTTPSLVRLVRVRDGVFITQSLTAGPGEKRRQRCPNAIPGRAAAVLLHGGQHGRDVAHADLGELQAVKDLAVLQEMPFDIGICARSQPCSLAVEEAGGNR